MLEDDFVNRRPEAPEPAERVTRRDFLLGTAALAGSVAVPMRNGEAATPPAAIETIDVTPRLIEAAKREGSLVVRYGSSVEEMAEMARGFQTKFGIKVLPDRKVGTLGTQQFAAEERAGQHVMDVNYSSDIGGLRDLADEGLMLRFTLADLDKKLDKGSYLPGLGYSPKWTDIVIAYNPDLIPHATAREQFKTWRGLLDPKLKGKIGVTDPAVGLPFFTYLMLLQRPEYGRRFLEQLAAQNPRLYSGAAPAREDLASGAISVFVPYWESALMLDFLQGGKTAWTYPEIAPTYCASYLTVSKQAPHPNAARLFAAWFFTPDGTRSIQGGQSRPTLKGIPDERTAVAKLRQTDWWRPYPASGHWVPNAEDWDNHYEKLMPDMRKVLGWRGR